MTVAEFIDWFLKQDAWFGLLLLWLFFWIAS